MDPFDLSAGYTLFVPRDDAFWRVRVQDATAPDPFEADDGFRLRTLLGHLVGQRMFSADMMEGKEIDTKREGATITVKKVDGGEV